MTRRTGPQILRELKSFRQMGSALYIAAHPDDENTELLAYLARGRHYRTAYLSLTRGDGGQNVLGSDLGAKLGMARTQELLAARQIDGAQQFFSRAVDFGFSKNYVETLNVWNNQAVLSDMVRVIRQFCPDILITRFSPSPGGTHGHHTASTVLAMEAYKLAGDSKAFPDQGLTPWQPKRIMWNLSPWQKDKIATTGILKIDAGGTDAISGESFTDIAGASRAMHKTQGFDSFKIQGVNGGPRVESFQLLDGEPAADDIMDGVETSWKRIAGGAEIGAICDQIISSYDPANSAASVPDLLRLRSKLSALANPTELASVIEEKRALLDRILQDCLGLEITTTVEQADAVPGEPVTLTHSASIAAKLPHDLSVHLVALRYPQISKEENKEVILHTGQTSTWQTVETLPVASLLAHPWWLRMEGSAGMFEVGDPKLIGSAENAPAFPIEAVFKIGNQTLVVHDQPLKVTTDATGKKTGRRLDIISPVSLQFDCDTVVLTPGASKPLTVKVNASRANARGILHLDGPAQWKITPANQPFNLSKAGESAEFKFTITAPALPSQAAIAKIGASADINGVIYNSRREEINYSHLPVQLLQAPAVVKAISVDLQTRGHNIGYLPGAGDSLVENLEQMGYKVSILDDNLSADKLAAYDAIVLGVRVFNVRKNISASMPALFEYVKNGGTLIVQYNRPDKMTVENIAPYNLHISGSRVTDEKAKITFLAPDHAIFNQPNKITPADFDNWVQERGLYFADQWAPQFTPLIACNDEGEAPLKGGLLVAKYGKGHYIYTGLGFFRQLPAGVPGAYRLLANMIAVSMTETEKNDSD